MTVRDVAVDFAYQPPTGSRAEICTGSIVGTAQTFLAPNSYDAGPFGTYLTEFSPMDTILSAGGQNLFVETGTGQGMKLCVDWVTAPAGSGTIQTQLITCALSNMSTPLVMIDFGAQLLSRFVAGYRQIMMLPRSNQWARFLSL